MSKQISKNKIRFAPLDAVVLIVAVALALTLVFRFTSDMKLFTYKTDVINS